MNSHPSASAESVAILAQVWFKSISFKPKCSRNRHPLACLLRIALYVDAGPARCRVTDSVQNVGRGMRDFWREPLFQWMRLGGPGSTPNKWSGKVGSPHWRYPLQWPDGRESPIICMRSFGRPKMMQHQWTVKQLMDLGLVFFYFL